MYEDNIKEACHNVFKGLNAIPDDKKIKKDYYVLAMMCKLDLGIERNEDMYRKLLPDNSDWANDWIDKYSALIDD